MNPQLARLAAVAAQPSRRIIGLMSGTSLDGLDVALCRCTGHGASLHVVLEQFATVPYAADFQQRLRAISQPKVQLEDVVILNAEVARRHAAILLQCLAEWGLAPADVDVLASHGQTIWHAPRHQHGRADFGHHATLQIGDGDHLARLTGILTVSDFRQKHVAAGYEGAPLAPFADELLFRKPGVNRLLLNLGGIANFTLLPADGGPAQATDTGPGNTLLDTVARQHYPGLAYDPDGQYAAQGRPHAGLLAALRSHPFFTEPFPKTTGPELFSPAYLAENQRQTNTKSLSAPDLLATLVELTASMVAEAMHYYLPPPATAEVLVSGGGAHNATLLAALARHLPTSHLRTTAEAAVPPDAKEAILFAVLANETLAGSPTLSLGKISLPG
ncbi:anhydro-N-acetylmuramic acid kinase [Hymenobacter ginsengisoli]|uniref:Anhydro-N-acetylmuramic acid kinase n=1 Tax=Hymenobacter ginsengisoli TaxID=1051626 RepID=A0ABP8QA58_9BACT|nr:MULTISPECIES: anhydro-N-acetylmuramic acid kinase [unclassified Hymenobacter]MBO2031577.1 anhydro-N-acetylmuramic acid kinase [Hymenobacter sp. BT559]